MTEPNGKESCKVCHGMYASAYMSTHMRKAHGVYGGKSGRVRRVWPDTTNRYEKAQINGRADMVVAPTMAPKAPTVPPNPNPHFKVVPMLVLEDQDGGLWLAERLK